MSTARISARVRANRANAARSTGPRTAEGKARSAQNARTHGLRAARGSPGDNRPHALADFLAGPDASPALRAAALELAEANFIAERARRALEETVETLVADHPARRSLQTVLDGFDPIVAAVFDPVERAWIRGAAPVDRKEIRLVCRIARFAVRLRRQQARDLLRQLRRTITYWKKAEARQARAARDLVRLQSEGR